MHLVALAFLLVFRAALLLFDFVHRIAANIAHGDARGFGIFTGDLGQFRPAFLAQFRQRHADERAIEAAD